MLSAFQDNSEQPYRKLTDSFNNDSETINYLHTQYKNELYTPSYYGGTDAPIISQVPSVPFHHHDEDDYYRMHSSTHPAEQGVYSYYPPQPVSLPHISYPAYAFEHFPVAEQILTESNGPRGSIHYNSFSAGTENEEKMRERDFEAVFSSLAEAALRPADHSQKNTIEISSEDSKVLQKRKSNRAAAAKARAKKKAMVSMKEGRHAWLIHHHARLQQKKSLLTSVLHAMKVALGLEVLRSERFTTQANQ